MCLGLGFCYVDAVLLHGCGDDLWEFAGGQQVLHDLLVGLLCVASGDPCVGESWSGVCGRGVGGAAAFSISRGPRVTQCLGGREKIAKVTAL